MTGVVLAGCTAVTTSTAESTTADTAVIETTVTVDSDLAAEAVLAANEDYATVNDDEWDAASAVDVTLSGSSESSSSDAVAIDGSTVTITAPGDFPYARLTYPLPASIDSAGISRDP